MNDQLRLFDLANDMNDAEDVREYLALALEDGDPKLIQATLGAIARSKGMTQIAKDTGLNRGALYTALSMEGNPTLDTITKVAKSLGMKLTLTPA